MAFCEDCAKLGISRERFLHRPDDAKHMSIPLASLEKMRERSQCPLCRLICRVSETDTFSEWQKEPKDQFHSSWINSEYGIAASGERIDYIALSQGSYRINLDVQQLYVRLIDRDQPHPFLGRYIDSHLIDFELTKSWLDECSKEHALCRELRPQSIADSIKSYLIDVVDWRLVRGDFSSPYFALSYVWGECTQFVLRRSNLDQLLQHRGLEPHRGALTNTIADAIEFTHQMGCRYLWVDALCIVQDDPDEKMHVINQMDHIYQGAVTTIIAAGGDDANAGLKGTRNRPRTASQLIERASDDCSLLAHAGHKEHVNRSVYNMRAWTFQEFQLSRRSFLFVDERIYFRCFERTFTEEAASEGQPHPDAMHRSSAHKRLLFQPEHLFTHYIWAVQQYTSRALRNAEDKVAAFAGVLSVQCRGFDCQPIAGLPSAFFDAALLWQPLFGRYRRVAGFPSWSWAGWDCEVMWYNDQTFSAVADSTVNQDKEDKTIGSWLRERTWVEWKVVDVPGAGESSPNLLDLPSRTVAGGGRGRPPSSLAFSTREVQVDLQVAPRPYPLLKFATMSVRFILGASGMPMRFGVADPYPHSRRDILVFVLLNCDAKSCGWVQLDEPWKVHEGSEYEFLLLSEADYYMDYFSLRPHHDHPYTRGGKVQMGSSGWEEFHAMMVTPNQDGTYERVGLGRVMQGAIADSCEGPAEWKEVILA